MPSVRVSKELKEEIFFLTFTVHRWYYLFDRHNRWDILIDSLKYCQANKGLQIYHFVFMLNHLHLIAKSSDMIGFGSPEVSGSLGDTLLNYRQKPEHLIDF